MSEKEVLSDMSRLLKMKLLRNDILIEWEPARDTYARSGLIRPDTHKEMHYTGTIINRGPYVYDVKVGERVFFDRFSRPERFDFDGRRFALITESACMLIIPSRAEIYA